MASVTSTTPDLVDHDVAVDFASTDDRAAAAAAVDDPRAEVIRPASSHRGRGTNFSGHRRPWGIRPDVSVVMASDAHMHPADLLRLLDPVPDVDAGGKVNRLHDAKVSEGMPRHHLVGSVLRSPMAKAASDKLNMLRVPACDVLIPARYGHDVSSMPLHRIARRRVGRIRRGFAHRTWGRYVLRSSSPVTLTLSTALAYPFVGPAFSVVIGAPVARPGTVLLVVVPLLSSLHLLISATIPDFREVSR